MTLKDKLEDALQDWDGDYGVSFRGDAPLNALAGDDPFADFDLALAELRSEASAVLDAVERARELVRPAQRDAQQAADAIEDVEGEAYDDAEARATAARNAAFLAAIDGEPVGS